MLSGMHASYVAASVSVGEIEECVSTGAAAVGKGAGDVALIKIDRSRVKIRRRAIRDRGKFEIISTLLCAAALLVSAVKDAGLIDRRPTDATICRSPDALTVIICVDVPGIHLIPSRHDRDFATEDRASGVI